MRVVVSMFLLSLLCGCDDVHLPQTKQLNERVAALDRRVTALEATANQPARGRCTSAQPLRRGT